jgi:hypothetical protein
MLVKKSFFGGIKEKVPTFSERSEDSRMIAEESSEKRPPTLPTFS